MDLLHLTTEHADGAEVVIGVAGELDVATTPLLRRKVAELVSRGHNRLVLDLERLVFIDSTGIGALIGARHRAREANGSLLLRAVPDRVQTILSVIGLDGVLEVERDVVDLACPAPSGADLALR